MRSYARLACDLNKYLHFQVKQGRLDHETLDKLAFPETMTDDQFLRLFSVGSVPSNIRTPTDPGRPEFRRTVFSNKVSRFILPFFVFFFLLTPRPLASCATSR